jgi:hypothetical protein
MYFLANNMIQQFSEDSTEDIDANATSVSIDAKNGCNSSKSCV